MREMRRERLREEGRTRDNPAIRRWGAPLSGGAHNTLGVSRPEHPLLPSIIFPLGPPSCGDECRAERALGCGRIFPWGQQAGATGEEAAEVRGRLERLRVESRVHDTTYDPLVEEPLSGGAHDSLRVPRPD